MPHFKEWGLRLLKFIFLLINPLLVFRKAKTSLSIHVSLASKPSFARLLSKQNVN